jgi:hypothetical protein
MFILASMIFGKQSVSFSTFDCVILFFFFWGGFLLVLQRKIFWIGSIGTLFLIAIANLYRSSVLAAQMESFDYQFMLSSGVLLSVGLISYFYRFPYLDSRDMGIFGIADRFKADMPAKLEAIEGRVLSASISGVLFLPETKIESVHVGAKMKLTIPELDLKDISVEVRGTKGDNFRLKFIWLGFAQFRDLKARLKTLPREDKSA